MSLRTRIQDDMKAALRAKEAARLSAIRLLLAAVKQREVDERIELDDDAILSVVEKLVKQRRDAAAQYDTAGDYHRLGNLTQGTTIGLQVSLPSSSPLSPVLEVYRGTDKVAEGTGPTFSYSIPEGGDGAYTMRITGAMGTLGLLSEYLVAITIGDASAPTIVGDGLPVALRESFPPAQRIRLPMRPDNRSMNLSNTVAVVVFEAWRQNGYAGGA